MGRLRVFNDNEKGIEDADKYVTDDIQHHDGLSDVPCKHDSCKARRFLQTRIKTSQENSVEKIE